ncbi:MAG: amidase [Acidimicrobiales bacterium]|jgi:amidase
MPEPHQLSAVEARSLIGAGQLSPVELLESCLAQTDRIDPAVNAMVTRADERARAEAADAETAVSRGDELGPLHGLPVAIKDLQPTEGITTTFGSVAMADNVPAEDAGIVAKVRAAGGIVIGKTNIPEYSIGANTLNRLFGATGNPFDVDRTCGGSSGGSAVALATEMAPLATGSDHGGSLRIPACYCGVVGHRSSPGVVPHEARSITQTFYSVQGPMGRTVADTALLLSVVAGRQPDPSGFRDPMAFPLDAPALAQLEDVDLKELRVGFTEDLGGVLVSESIRHTFRDRLERIAPLVGRLEPAPVDLTAAAEVDWRIRSDVFVAQYHRDVEHWDEGFNPNIRASYNTALQTPVEDIGKARRLQIDLFQAFQTLYEQFDVILCPGVSVSPFLWNDLYPREVDGAPIDNYMAWLALTASITVIGHPVTALPCGLDSFGLPFGLQVVGPMYGDHRTLSIAAALETVFTADAAMARPIPDFAALATTDGNVRDAGRAAATAAAIPK